jgi:hypothetical protein
MRLYLISDATHTNIQTFRHKHKTLVWSNSKAPDRTLIMHALLRSEFAVVLDAAQAFGLDVLKQEWQILLAEGSAEVERVRERTEHILSNIEFGYRQAASKQE